MTKQARIYNLSNMTLDEISVISEALLYTLNAVRQRVREDDSKAAELYKTWEDIPFNFADMNAKASAGRACSSYLDKHPQVVKVEKQIFPVRMMVQDELFRNCRKMTEAGNLIGKKGT